MVIMLDNARHIAASALKKVASDGAYSNIVLNNMLSDAELSKEDKALCTTIFYGTLDRLVTIDYYLKKLIKTPLKKVKPYTLAVMRSAVFQIKYLDKIPNSAAVNEAVSLVKRSKEGFNASFVNGVLRNLLRTETPLPNGKSINDISVRYSCPAHIVSMLIDDYGDDFTASFLESCLEPPPIYIRVNTLKTTTEKLILELSEKGVATKTTKEENALIISGCSVEGLDEYKNGLFFVQDLSCQLTVKSLEIESGSRVLDMCAAPGGKSFTAAMYAKDGEVLSFDLYKQRVELIKSGAERLGIKNILASVGDATVFDNNIGSFDRIICDVPCSGIGVIRRKPDIKYNKAASFEELGEIQRRILENADRYLKVGGKLLYSTCTLNKKENRGNVDWFLSRHKNYSLCFEKTYCPQTDGSDGFYAAVLYKSR